MINIGDVLPDLKLDTWYKVFIVIGTLALCISFFVELPPIGLDNGQLQSIAAGVILIGCGVWKCKRKQKRIKPPNAYTGGVAIITRTYYVFDILGVLFILGGAFLILNAFIKII